MCARSRHLDGGPDTIHGGVRPCPGGSKRRDAVTRGELLSVEPDMHGVIDSRRAEAADPDVMGAGAHKRHLEVQAWAIGGIVRGVRGAGIGGSFHGARTRGSGGGAERPAMRALWGVGVSMFGFHGDAAVRITPLVEGALWRRGRL